MALIAYPDGPDAAVTDPAEVASLLHLTNVSVALGWTLQPRPWLASADLRGVATRSPRPSTRAGSATCRYASPLYPR
jgi:hypothetical protein